MSLGDYLSQLGGAAASAVNYLGTSVAQAPAAVSNAGAPPPSKAYIAGLLARAVALDSQVQTLAAQNQLAFRDLVQSWNNYYQGEWQPFYANYQGGSMPEDQAMSLGRNEEGQIGQWEARAANAQAAPAQDVKVESYITQLQSQIDAIDLGVRKLPDSIPGNSFVQFKSDWNTFLQGTWYAFANSRSGMAPADKNARAAAIAPAIAAWATKLRQAQALVANAGSAPASVPGSNKGAPQVYTPPQPQPQPDIDVPLYQPPKPAAPAAAPAKSSSTGLIVALLAVVGLGGLAIATKKG